MKETKFDLKKTKFMGWKNRPTYVVSLHLNQMEAHEEIRALLRSKSGLIGVAAIVLRENTIGRFSTPDLHPMHRTALYEFMMQVDWVEIVETFTAEDEQ